MLGVTPAVRRAWRLVNETVRGTIHQIIGISQQVSAGVLTGLGSYAVHQGAVAHRNVTAPVVVGGRNERPRLRGEIKHRITVPTPVVLVKIDMQPLGSSPARQAVNTDRLSRGCCRPIINIL